MKKPNPFITESTIIVKTIELNRSEVGYSTTFAWDVLHSWDANAPTQVVCEFRTCVDAEDEDIRRYNSFKVHGYTKSGRVRIEMKFSLPTEEVITDRFVEVKKTISHKNALEILSNHFCLNSGTYHIIK
jgi:hypothetical protein